MDKPETIKFELTREQLEALQPVFEYLLSEEMETFSILAQIVLPKEQIQAYFKVDEEHPAICKCKVLKDSEATRLNHWLKYNVKAK